MNREAEKVEITFLTVQILCISFRRVRQWIHSNGKLKDEFVSNKIAALNKAGHGLHICSGSLNDYTKSSKIFDLVKELDRSASLTFLAQSCFVSRSMSSMLTPAMTSLQLPNNCDPLFVKIILRPTLSKDQKQPTCSLFRLELPVD